MRGTPVSSLYIYIKWTNILMNDKIHPEFNQMKSSEKVKGFMIWSIVKGVLIWQMKRRSKNSDESWSQSTPPATFGHFQMISYRTPNMICFSFKIHQKWQKIYESLIVQSDNSSCKNLDKGIKIS